MSDLNPYTGPTEEEAMEACDTSVQEVERLSAALGVKSGFEDDPRSDDDV